MTNELKKSQKEAADYKYALDESCIVAITDQQGIITYVNDNFCSISKYPREELLGRDHRIVNAGFHQKEFIRTLWGTIAKGNTWRGQMKNRAKDESLYWSDTTIVPFLNEAGKPYQYVSICIDITAQKLNEERYRQIVENSQEGIWTIDENNKTDFANKRMADILETSPEEMIGKSPFDFMREEDMPYAAKVIKDQKHNIKDIQEFVFETRSGNKVGAELSTNPIFDDDGHYKGVLAMVTNITRRMKAEAELQDTEERLVFHIANTPLGYIEWDEQYQVKTWSRRAGEIFGWSRSEALDTGTIGFYNVYPEDQQAAILIAEELISGSVNQNTIQHRNITKDGRIIWCEWFNSVLKNDEGKVVSIMSLVQDITERKKQEEEQQNIVAELIKMNADLKQFSFITSHNFRAPLSNIKGILSLIDRTALNDYNNQLLNMLETSTGQLNDTIDDITKILVIKANISRPVEDINLHDVYTRVEQNFSTALLQAAGYIVVDFQVPVVRFHAVYLESILLNLISNAINFRSRSRALHISVTSSRRDDDNVELIVSDNGSGIDMNRHGHRIFGLYQRFHQNTAGHGLGLFIVKSQVEALGGTIEIQSEVDKGTTFRIVLGKYPASEY